MNRFELTFIVGGVQKAGTTSLFGYLQDHPGLQSPLGKELHFFDNETIDWSRPDYSLLRQFFAVPDDKRPAFDVTPIYLFWPPALQRIHDYNPTIKLLFIFRDPIERAWSHWSMERSRNAEDLPFHLAIRSGRWRLRGISRYTPAWRVYSYVERGFYGSQVRRLLELFPRENILFLRSNDLLERHHDVLASVAEFLGLSPFPNVAKRLDHQNKDSQRTLPARDFAYLREIFMEEVLDFSRLTGLSVADWPTVSGERVQ